MNGRTHQSEYAKDGITTKEAYEKRALALLGSPVSNHILGHINEGGGVIRYDTEKNDFVKGHPDKGVKTLFKPTEGREYYEKMRKEDLDHGGKA